MNNIIIDSRELCDLDLLLNGSFNPVNTFMNEKEYHSVLENVRLTTGEVFPMPIVLSTQKNFHIGDNVILVDQYNYPIASLDITEIYDPDVEKECNAIFGCCDDNHPYIKRILSILFNRQTKF